MATTPGRFRLQPSRRICFVFIFLCQLSWILPFIFFLLFQSSTPRVLIVEDRNASKKINTQGFSGPIKIFSDQDLYSLGRIHEEWNRFWPAMRENLSSQGFVQPAERTCFIWLLECFLLAKHDRILQMVEAAIGSKVLLYGMTVWDRNKEALQRFHRDEQVGDCEKAVNFVSGTSVQLISQSHKIPDRLLQALLRNLQSIEEESLTFPSKQEQLDFLERSFVTKVKRMVRNSDVWLENLELGNGSGVFFHGGTLYRTGEVLGDGRGLLLQFISADCKVRDSTNSAWGSQGTSYSLYMPPVLLVAGDYSEVSVANDVRLALAKEEDLLSGRKEVIDRLVGGEREFNSGSRDGALQAHNVTVFSEANAALVWQDEGIWRFRTVGEASTTTMAMGKIEQFSLRKELLVGMDYGMMAGDWDQVVVVLSEGMLYFRAIKDDDFYYYELSELRPGSAVLLSKKLLHAVVPLGPETGFMSFRWVGHGNETLSGKPQHNGKNTKTRELSIKNLFNGELLGQGFTQAIEGRTIMLSSGQAYDPDNNEFCDVVIFMVEGYLLQVLPSNVTLQAFDVLLIPAHQSCILWNVGGLPVKFFAMHLCHFEDAIQIMTSYGASGKVF